MIRMRLIAFLAIGLVLGLANGALAIGFTEELQLFSGATPVILTNPVNNTITY